MLRLAYRLAHYQGCIRSGLVHEARGAAPKPEPAPAYPDSTWVPSTPQAVAASPLSRYVDFAAVSDV